MYKTNTIHNADCLEGMKTIPDDSIDFIFADFPYNISQNKNNLTKRGNEVCQGDFGNWDKFMTVVDYQDWVFKILFEMHRVSKPNASLVLFFDYRLAGWFAHEVERRRMFVYKSPLIWAKNNPVFHVRKTAFRSSFEHGIWLVKSSEDYMGNPDVVVKSKTFNFLSQQEMKNVMAYNIGCKDTDHPTEKPLELVERMVKIFTDPGDLVLDPFMGGGTTAVACIRNDREYIGFELDKDYCDKAVIRVDAETRMLSSKELNSGQGALFVDEE